MYRYGCEIENKWSQIRLTSRVELLWLSFHVHHKIMNQEVITANGLFFDIIWTTYINPTLSITSLRHIHLPSSVQSETKTCVWDFLLNEGFRDRKYESHLIQKAIIRTSLRRDIMNGWWQCNIFSISSVAREIIEFDNYKYNLNVRTVFCSCCAARYTIDEIDSMLAFQI